MRSGHRLKPGLWPGTGIRLLLAITLLSRFGCVHLEGQAASPAFGTGDLRITPKTASGEPVELGFYLSPDCRSCLEFLEQRLPAIAESRAKALLVHRVDIMEPGGFDALRAEMGRRGLALRALPVLVTGTHVFQGEAEIEEGIPAVLGAEAPAAAGRESESAPRLSKPAEGTLDSALGTPRIAVAAVIVGGLIDGINPCAFTTIVFLLSSLALAGRSRRQVLVVGACFSAAVYVTYTAIGMGALSLLRGAEFFPLVSKLLRYAMAAALVVLAALSLRDYFRVRRGETANLSLQLPLGMKRRIHALIRGQRASTRIVAGSLVLGALVATFELGCTGQIYLPIIVYLIRTTKGAGGYLALLLYNLAFILPLLVVFTLTGIGVGAPSFADFAKSRLGTLKIITMLIFIAMAALLALT